MKNDCIFCAIIDGEMPSYKIYEDDMFYVILDRFPKCLGHVLILTKRHAAHIFALTEEESKRLIPLTQKIAVAMKKALEYEGLNLLQNNGSTAGQEVMHFHLHLIPRFDGDAMAIQYRREDPNDEEFLGMVEKIEGVLN